MAAFLVREGDWSGAGELFPLRGVDSLSLGLHVTPPGSLWVGSC